MNQWILIGLPTGIRLRGYIQKQKWIKKTVASFKTYLSIWKQLMKAGNIKLTPQFAVSSTGKESFFLPGSLDGVCFLCGSPGLTTSRKLILSQNLVGGSACFCHIQIVWLVWKSLSEVLTTLGGRVLVILVISSGFLKSLSWLCPEL